MTSRKFRHFWPTLWCHELISCLCPGAKKCINPFPSLDDVLLKLIVKWSIIQTNIWTLDWNSLVFRWWSEYRVPGGYNRDQTSEYQTCKSPVFRCFCDSDVSVIQMSRIRIPTTKIFLEPSCSVQLYLQQAFKFNRALLDNYVMQLGGRHFPFPCTRARTKRCQRGGRGPLNTQNCGPFMKSPLQLSCPFQKSNHETFVGCCFK